MKGRLGRRSLVPLVAAALGAILTLAPAHASAAGETTLAYSGNPATGSSITVTADRGTVNSVLVDMEDPPTVTFRDTNAGIMESPDTPACNPISSTQINCLSQGLRSVSVNTGDMDDRAAVGGGIDQTVDIGDVIFLVMGTGDDRVRYAPFDQGGGPSVTRLRRPPLAVSSPVLVDISGQIKLGPGNDTATVSGRARVSGGRGKDKLRGRKGNQKLFGNQQNDRISCGKGKRDLGNGGGGTDTIASSCERIVNR